MTKQKRAIECLSDLLAQNSHRGQLPVARKLSTAIWEKTQVRFWEIRIRRMLESNLLSAIEYYVAHRNRQIIERNSEPTEE